jgi:hypothetical protein
MATERAALRGKGRAVPVLGEEDGGEKREKRKGERGGGMRTGRGRN